MRLIDADELKKDDEMTRWLSNDAIRTGKQLKMFSELFINKIDNMPTVQAVPIDVLDKIRAEIARKANSGQWSEAVIYGMQKSIAIIDKYRQEE